MVYLLAQITNRWFSWHLSFFAVEKSFQLVKESTFLKSTFEHYFSNSDSNLRFSHQLFNPITVLDGFLALQPRSPATEKLFCLFKESAFEAKRSCTNDKGRLSKSLQRTIDLSWMPWVLCIVWKVNIIKSGDFLGICNLFSQIKKLK